MLMQICNSTQTLKLVFNFFYLIDLMLYIMNISYLLYKKQIRFLVLVLILVGHENNLEASYQTDGARLWKVKLFLPLGKLSKPGWGWRRKIKKKNRG